VDDFVARAVVEPGASLLFPPTDSVRLKAMLVDYICQASGGPCRTIGTKYKGVFFTGNEALLIKQWVMTLDKFKVQEKDTALSSR
jgi:hemoglobin